MIIFKNFLRTLILLTLLVATNNVMGSAPGLDAWKDDAGNTAPASVRKAADNLWTAVTIEGKNAFNAGVGIRKEVVSEWGCLRIMAIALCGIAEFDRYLAVGDLPFNEVVQDHRFSRTAATIVYDQRNKEVQEALQVFKDIVNGSVSRPEGYSGDANICNLGGRVEDNRWCEEVKGPTGTYYKFVGVSHDLREVPRSVRLFVNAHGGWDSEKDVKKGIIVLVDKESQ